MGRRSTAGPTVLRALALAGGLAVALAGCSPTADPRSSTGSAVTSSTAGAGAAGAGQTSGAPGRTTSVLTALAGVAVRGRAPLTGYTREAFGQAWVDTDHDGCDTRDDVLARDLSGTTARTGTHGCVVLSGTLHDPYSGTTIAFRRGEGTSAAVQIDHVVALGDAWQTGAQQWTTARRTAFANDPLELLAVDGPLNEAKGDGDAATWLPPNRTYRCAYVARQVAVKTRYGLWMTGAEHDAAARVLSACPDQPLPVATASAWAQASPGTSPGTSPGAPSGATARCRDGSWSSSAHRTGACSGHGGIAQWL